MEAEAWILRRERGRTEIVYGFLTVGDWILHRRLNPKDEVSRDGVKWRRLGSLPELAPLFALRAHGRTHPRSASGWIAVPLEEDESVGAGNPDVSVR
jgi:hypothetical protein